MDTKFKKTALGDDALIYQRSKDTITKEELRKLPLRQRLGYFRDYYLKIVVVVVLAAALVLSVLNTAVFNRSECVLSVCFLGDAALPDGETLSASLEELIAPEGKNDYINLEAFYLDNYQMNMAFTTRIAAGTIDLIICSRSDFTEQSERGVFCDLRDVLPEDLYGQLSGRILESSVAERDDHGNIVSYGDPVPFGIDLSGSGVYQECGGLAEDPVLCAAVNLANTENALAAVRYLTGV